MELSQKILTLVRSGITREAAAVILGVTEADVAAQLHDPATADPAPPSGGGLAQQANGAFGDPTVAPSFLGWFDDYNTVAALDTTGMKAGTWAHAYNATLGEPVIMLLDVDSGTFMVVSVTG